MAFAAARQQDVPKTNPFRAWRGFPWAFADALWPAQAQGLVSAPPGGAERDSLGSSLDARPSDGTTERAREAPDWLRKPEALKLDLKHRPSAKPEMHDKRLDPASTRSRLLREHLRQRLWELRSQYGKLRQILSAPFSILTRIEFLVCPIIESKKMPSPTRSKTSPLAGHGSLRARERGPQPSNGSRTTGRGITPPADPRLRSRSGRTRAGELPRHSRLPTGTCRQR